MLHISSFLKMEVKFTKQKELFESVRVSGIPYTHTVVRGHLLTPKGDPCSLSRTLLPPCTLIPGSHQCAFCRCRCACCAPFL